MDLMKKLVNSKTIRYIFFGGLSTLVNLGTYYILSRVFGVNLNLTNVISILSAILFAYIVNKLYVFESKTKGMKALLKEAAHFISMRFLTMFVEIFGVIFFICVWGLNDLVSKIIIQVVIMVLNYLISRFLVFNKDGTKAVMSKAQRTLHKRRNLCYALSFFIPVIVIIIAFIFNKVFPFGDRAVLIIDSAHQYLPFFTEFHRKLSASSSLLYTFSAGMGNNFWAIYAYYLAGPFNLFIMLFPEEFIMEGMAFLIILKIGISGFAFSNFLMKKNEKYNLTVVAFSIMFALSTFTVGYYFNLMWLDSIMLLPFVMLGIWKLVNGKGGYYYGAFLFLAIYSNYYIGFMICIFSCFYYLVQVISLKKITIKKMLTSVGWFAWYSLIGGGMASIVLIPAFKALQITQSITENSGFPKELKFYTTGLTTLTQHFALVEPITISNDDRGKLNIFCGVLALIIMCLYLLDNKIHIRERIAKALLCVFIFVSFSINYLNYVWHGFHEQNGLPNRFAFLYIALLLTMGFEVINHVKRLDIKRIVVSCFVPMAFVLFCFWQNYGEHEIYVYIITLVLLNIYTWLMVLYRNGTIKKFGFCLILLTVTVVEMGVNGVVGFMSNGTINRSGYLADQEAFQALMKTQEDDTFYRSEMDGGKNGTLIRNGIMYQGGRGIVIFSSTVPERLINLQERLGLEARANKSGYGGTTKFVNDIFGVKYLAAKINVERLYGFTKLGEYPPLTLYKNEEALSIGFMVNTTIKDWDIETGEHIDVQNDFIVKATGESPLFEKGATYPVTETQTLTFELAPHEQMYLDLNKAVEDVKITTPTYTKTYNKYTNHLFDLGSYEEGASVTVEFTVLEDQNAQTAVTVYSYQKEDYKKINEILARNQLEVTKYTDNSLEGTILVEEAKTLFLSIPNEDGWTIKVDGKEVEYYVIADTLIGLDLEVGEHTLEMKYTPSGLWLGSTLSILCIILYFATFVIDGKKKGGLSQAEGENILAKESAGGLHAFSRTELLLGKNGMKTLSETSVAVFGMGGVGSYVVEALARSGVGSFTLFDNDCVSLTNINRQLIADYSSVGRAKVELAKARIRAVNPIAKVTCHEVFYTHDNARTFSFERYDYIVDAIDTVSSKILLIEQAKRSKVPIISCMGTGNKLDPTLFEVADIYETSMCPLAKVIRSELRKREIAQLKVVYSKEQPLDLEIDTVLETKGNTKRPVPGSISFVPSVAGLIMAGEVIKDITGVTS